MVVLCFLFCHIYRRFKLKKRHFGKIPNLLSIIKLIPNKVNNILKIWICSLNKNMIFRKTVDVLNN